MSAIVVVQATDSGAHSASSSGSLSFASTPSVGNAAIISVQLKGSGTPVVSTLTDNHSNTYSRIASLGFSGGDNELWWCPSIVSSSGTFTVTPVFNVSAAYVISIMEVAGLTGTVDQMATATGAGGGSSPISITMGAQNTGANALVIALMSGAYGYGGTTGMESPPTSSYTAWSFYDTPNSSQMVVSHAYKAVSALETSSAQWTFSTVSGDREQMLLVSLDGFGGVPANPEPFAYTLQPATLTVNSNLLLAAPAFAFTLEPATLAAGGALSLAASSLAFVTSLSPVTVTSGSSFAANNLAFNLNLQPNVLNYNSANYELLAAPLGYFFNLDPDVAGNQLTISPLAWLYSIQPTLAPATPVPYVLGITEAQAKTVLAQYDFNNIQIDLAYDVVNPPGVVFAQSPAAGTPWLPSSIVTLVVSQGPFVPLTQQTIPGTKVTTRAFSLEEMVSREWGSSFRAPDHRIYEFTNGRGFDSTDMGTTGIYSKGIENAALPLPPGSIMLPNGDIQLPNGQIIVPGAPPAGGN